VNLARVLTYVVDRCVRWPMGKGHPVAKSVWDEQFRGGFWDYLYSDRERAHYEAIVALALEARAARVLDVGCGQGRLLELLRASPHLRTYVGTDISETAIALARALDVPGARFEVGDFEKWDSDERFDAIIFNESLYYSASPLAVLRRYAGLLSPGGRFIISFFEHDNSDTIWRRIERHFRILGSIRIENDEGQRWIVRSAVAGNDALGQRRHTDL
jgi:SAM-dependent methyltransferase